MESKVLVVKEIEVKVRIKPTKIKFPSISVFNYQNSLIDEIDEGKIIRRKCFELLEQMLIVRTLEEIITEIVAGVYKPLPNFKYTGPTHLSIGQETTSIGSIVALELSDYITSSRRGHDDALSKGLQ